jgi:hypothetical protein
MGRTSHGDRESSAHYAECAPHTLPEGGNEGHAPGLEESIKDARIPYYITVLAGRGQQFSLLQETLGVFGGHENSDDSDKSGACLGKNVESQSKSMIPTTSI